MASTRPATAALLIPVMVEVSQEADWLTVVRSFAPEFRQLRAAPFIAQPSHVLIVDHLISTVRATLTLSGWPLGRVVIISTN